MPFLEMNLGRNFWLPLETFGLLARVTTRPNNSGRKGPMMELQGRIKLRSGFKEVYPNSPASKWITRPKIISPSSGTWL